MYVSLEELPFSFLRLLPQIEIHQILFEIFLSFSFLLFSLFSSYRFVFPSFPLSFSSHPFPVFCRLRLRAHVLVPHDPRVHVRVLSLFRVLSPLRARVLSRAHVLFRVLLVLCAPRVLFPFVLFLHALFRVHVQLFRVHVLFLFLCVYHLIQNLMMAGIKGKKTNNFG